MSTDRLAVAHVLEQIAGHLELKGENPFRVRAFRTAAKAIMGLSVGVEDAAADGSLAEVRGIGPATLSIVKEFLETGHSRVLEELRREIPPGLLDMLAIPGLGITRIRTVHETLKIDSIPALEAAARDGRLATLPGLGPKTAEKVLKGIGFVQGKRAFQLPSLVARQAEVLRATLAAIPGVRRVVTAGDLRRRSELVGELVFVVDAGDAAPAGILGALRSFPGITGVAGSERQAGFRIADGMKARVLVSASAGFGAALVQGTGSEAHLELLAAPAGNRGLTLEGGELRRGSELIPAPEEDDLYRALDLPVIPPELREGLDEVALAGWGNLPCLVERSDLAGLLHCHSTYSDGTAGIEELAAACRDAGYEYLGLTDHSQAAAYAGGLRAEDLLRQWEEIDRLNAARSGTRVLKGIEADILGNGQLDYDDATLAGFEFVIGSVHSRLGMDEPEMTARLLQALDHPALTILGHPTGRLLLSREPSRLDLDRLFARAAERGVALEINGDPHRLDLDWRLVRRAREHGVMISIGSDAHGIDGIAHMENALAMARKAGLTAGEVLNTRTADEFLDFARARRS
ncbi:MAG TPA: PHP domain-containing protein [Gemmatimonadales bacterium]|nr:PHP domain-containing protein [Gemmatimonadales bacterium]